MKVNSSYGWIVLGMCPSLFFYYRGSDDAHIFYRAVVGVGLHHLDVSDGAHSFYYTTKDGVLSVQMWGTSIILIGSTHPVGIAGFPSVKAATFASMDFSS